MKRVAAVSVVVLSILATSASAERGVRLSVAPKSVEAGQAKVFRFQAERGAVVRFAGKRARANRRGRAAIRATLTEPGRYVARSGRAKTVVTAREKPKPPAEQAGPKSPESFSGECAIDGVVEFDPPMTNTPQRITQTIDGKAAVCTGTFVDAKGRSHELAGADVSETTTAVSENMSCASALPSGPGTLFFPHGAIDVTFDEYRVGALPLVRFTGAAGGSLTGYASPTEDPAALVAKCGAEGIDQVHVEGQMQGEISG